MKINEDQLSEQYDKALETARNSRWPGMSYQQGVANTIEWILGGPMDEE